MKFPYLNLRTIKTHLLLLVLICILPAMGIIVYSGLEQSHGEIKRAKSDALQIVKNYSYAHKRTIESTRQFLMTLAEVPEIQNLNVTQSNKLLAELLKQNPLYSTLFVVNANGFVCASGHPLLPDPFSVRQRKYFQDTLRRKDFSVGEYAFCPVMKQPTLHFAYPIIDARDQFKGIIAVSINFVRFAQMFPIDELPQGSMLSFSDQRGAFLYRYPRQADNMPQLDLPDMIKHMSSRISEGIFSYTEAEGIKRLYAYKQFRLNAKEAPYLYIRVGIPEEEAFAHARKAISVNVLFLGIAFIIAMFSACFLGNAIIGRRLNRLVDASRRLGHGDLKTRTELDYKRDELGELAKAFDEMAGSLEIKNAQHEQAKDRLKKIADEWQTTFDSITDLIMILDNEGRVIRINNKAARFFDLPKDRILGDYCFPLLHEIGQSPESSLFHRMMETKQHEETDFYFARSGMWLFASADPILDDTGNVIGGVYIIKDITDRKWAEEALRESENKFKDLVEKSNVGVFLVQDGVHRYVNARCAEIHGYSVEEMIDKMGPKDTAFPEDWPTIGENIHKRMTGDVPLPHHEFRIITKNQEIKNVEIYGSRTTYQGRPAVIGTMLDITDRKQAEEALKESERELRMIFESMQAGVLIIDPETHLIVDLNPAAQKLIGAPREEIVGLLCHKHVCPTETGKCPVTDLRQNIENAERILVTANGEIRQIIKTVVPIILGARRYLLESFVDITELKQAEEQIRESEERFRQLAENIPEVFYIYETNTNHFSYISPAYIEIWGYPPSLSLYRESKPLLDAVYHEDKDRVIRSLGKKSQGEVEEIYRIVRFDGSIRWIKDRSFPISNSSGKVHRIVGIAADITDHKIGEEKLKYLSLHDALTGLYNRIYFKEEMNRIEKARYETVGIISCDVDGLKLVNDTLGHDQGDRLLIAASKVIRDSFREGDLVARIGGDEFSVVVPNTNEEAVEHACQRIQEAVSSYNATNPKLPLSISVGFAVSNGVYRNAKDLFKEADNNMYRKKLYRTQIVRNTIVKTLITTLKARDLTAEQHVIRLEKLLANMAAFIGLPESTISDLSLLARFHDIGNVGIPDSILFKRGPLTSEEWIGMKRHSEIGYRMALSAPELVRIADWILKHHEWWNGQGYPLGIQGEEIPIECRLLGITEAYEAMTSVRPYRKALSHTEAVVELLCHSGTQFDPQLLEKFVQMLEADPTQLEIKLDSVV